MRGKSTINRNRKDLASAKGNRKFAIFSTLPLLDVWRTSAPRTVPHVFLHSQHFARMLVSIACHPANVDVCSAPSGSFGAPVVRCNGHKLGGHLTLMILKFTSRMRMAC